MANRAARRRAGRQVQAREAQRRNARRQAVDRGLLIPPPPADAEHPAWHFWWHPGPAPGRGEWLLHDARVVEHITVLAELDAGNLPEPDEQE